jgi:mono/diheme cytochrome c family protein
MSMVRLVSLIAGVLGVSLVLAACGGESGGTTTIATEAGGATTPTGETTATKETTTARETTARETTAKEEPAKEKSAAKEKIAKAETGGEANAAVEQGKQEFMANGCGACHTLAAAGTKSTVGPDLDGTLPGKSESFIRESIVDPNADVAPGYSAGIMPPTFGSTLSSSELEALVTFLQQSAGK